MYSQTEPVVETKKGFCLYINTICQGLVPVQRDGNGYPFVYATEQEAQRDIADDMIIHLQQFLAGERDFEDAVTTEDMIVTVDVSPDGSITDEWGNHFGRDNW